MDIYTGRMTVGTICSEVKSYLENNSLDRHDAFMAWAGTGQSDFRVISLSDESQWILKYHNSIKHYVHIFPARQSPHTFRIKSNTLKSAILYIILIGRNYVTDDDLNKARAVAGLSPVREVADTEAVAEMIEVLRS